MSVIYEKNWQYENVKCKVANAQKSFIFNSTPLKKWQKKWKYLQKGSCFFRHTQQEIILVYKRMDME
jgi:hypothetical protein